MHGDESEGHASTAVSPRPNDLREGPTPLGARTGLEARLGADMGVFDRFWGRGPDGYKARAAQRSEMAGDLDGALRSFLDAELPDEAARVLMLRADAEPALDRRMAFCAQAARIAKDKSIVREALSRKARLRYDVLKGKGNAMRMEILLAAKELEEADENETAADAYALAEDREGEIRALTAAGLIDRLEDKLRVSQAEAKQGQDQGLALRRIQDLDRAAERREALRLAAEAFGVGQPDERIEELARVIRTKLLRGPVIELRTGGAVRRYALGAEVTVGRGESTIVVGTRSLSRVHLRVSRVGGDIVVEDAGTRNGTFLAGARIAGKIPLGAGLTLKLGGDVPCRVAPVTSEEEGGGVVVEVGGLSYFAPLGELSLGGWRVGLAGTGGDEASFVTLTTAQDVPAFLGDLQLATVVELAAGDAPSTARGGPVRFSVLGAGSEVGS